jgi:dTDP-glucose pyrophosphorylase
MIALVPMAGEGARFKAEGYTVPKPLIEVLGKPMVVQATASLPPADNHIFICRSFHIAEYQIDQALYQYYPNADILIVDHLTEGQASTCLIAKDYINNNKPLLIGASDNGMQYDLNRFYTETEKADCLVFTFRNNVTVVPKPQQYGWVAVDADNFATKVSVKVPISDSPLKDHAIVGAFWFREGKVFVDAAERMIAKNRRVNGEFYVDETINEVIEAGYKVKVFEIDQYICWGTPNDLRTFFYWEEFFKKETFHPYHNIL